MTESKRKQTERGRNNVQHRETTKQRTEQLTATSNTTTEGDVFTLTVHSINMTRDVLLPPVHTFYVVLASVYNQQQNTYIIILVPSDT